MPKKEHVSSKPTDKESTAMATGEEGTTALITSASERLETAVGKLSDEKAAGIRELAATLDPQQEGFGEMDDVRYRAPVIKVKQPVTTTAPKTAENGDIYSSDTGEVFEKPFPFIPVYPYENRARFQPGDMRPDCRSEDCKTSIYGDDCSKCPDRPWKDNKPQKCNNSVNIMAASLDFSKLYHLQFSKTSATAGTSVIRQTRNAGKKPWERTYHLDTEETKGGQGIYYVFKTTFIEGVDAAFLETGFALHDFLGEQRKKMKEELAKRIAEGKTAVDSLDDDVSTEDAGDSKGDFTDL